MRTALPPQIARLHAELGIPLDYASVRLLTLQVELDDVDLVNVAGGSQPGATLKLHRGAAAAWFELSCSAHEAGVAMEAISGFRSVRRQADIVRTRLKEGRSIEDILAAIAAPGYSEHHTGRAIDIGAPGDLPLEESFERTAAFQWINRNAGSFGFTLSYPRQNSHGFIYEPWHWLWCPR